MEDDQPLGNALPGAPMAYVFHHWSYVDTFVYFSHALICVPPAHWTRAAHRNGVRVLGSIVAEHERGTNDVLLLIGCARAASLRPLLTGVRVRQDERRQQ